MCGRMTLTRGDLDEVADEIEAVYRPEMAASYRPRWNVAPTDWHPIVVQDLSATRALRLFPAFWGMSRAGSSAAVINARAETAAQKPTFRDAFAKRRCLIPTDGFIEWGGQGQARRPFWLHAPAGKLLLFAGLYSDGPDGDPRFVVLTTAASGPVAALHDRMPVILSAEEIPLWLGEGLISVPGAPAGGVLLATPVSRRVNSVRNDDPQCLLPESEMDPPVARQLGLFPI